MPTTTETVKCACADCVCTVRPADAINAEGGAFCCEACAQHHSAGTGCGHAGCNCHG